MAAGSPPAGIRGLAQRTGERRASGGDLPSSRGWRSRVAAAPPTSAEADSPRAVSPPPPGRRSEGLGKALHGARRQRAGQPLSNSGRTADRLGHAGRRRSARPHRRLHQPGGPPRRRRGCARHPGRRRSGRPPERRTRRPPRRRLPQSPCSVPPARRAALRGRTGRPPTGRSPDRPDHHCSGHGSSLHTPLGDGFRRPGGRGRRLRRRAGRRRSRRTPLRPPRGPAPAGWG